MAPAAQPKEEGQQMMAEVVSKLNELPDYYRREHELAATTSSSSSPAASSVIVLDTPPIASDRTKLGANLDREESEETVKDAANDEEEEEENNNNSVDNLKDPDDSEQVEAKNKWSASELVPLTTSCGCPKHLGQLVVDQAFDIDVDTLFNLIFTNSKFMRTYMIRRGMTDTIVSNWRRSTTPPDTTTSSPVTEPASATTDGATEAAAAAANAKLVRTKQVRQLNYSMSLNHMWAKQVNIEERQSILRVRPGVYVLKSETINSGIPYGESFSVDMSYCLTRGEAAGKSRLLVHSFVNFNKDKQSWKLSMVKSLIERQSLQGVSEFMRDLTTSINDYIRLGGELLPQPTSEIVETGGQVSSGGGGGDDDNQQEKAAPTRDNLNRKQPPEASSLASFVRCSRQVRAKSRLKERKLRNMYRYYIDDHHHDHHHQSNQYQQPQQQQAHQPLSTPKRRRSPSAWRRPRSRHSQQQQRASSTQNSTPASSATNSEDEEEDEDDEASETEETELFGADLDAESLVMMVEEEEDAEEADDDPLDDPLRPPASPERSFSDVEKHSGRRRLEGRGRRRRSISRQQPSHQHQQRHQQRSGGRRAQRRGRLGGPAGEWAAKAAGRLLWWADLGHSAGIISAGLLLVATLLLVLLALLVSHALILSRLDSLEAEFRQNCAQLARQQ